MGVGPDIISPLKSVEREYDDVDKEIIRLGDMGVSPPETVREITYEGVTIELTPEQRDKVALLRTVKKVDKALYELRLVLFAIQDWEKHLDR